MEHNSTQLREILVPVDGSRASLDAVALACSVAKRNKGRVYVVYVIEVARTLPLDAELAPEAQRGEEILADAEQVADEMDCEVEGELLQAREAGHAIVDEAIERGVDGIILGIAYQAPQSRGFDWPTRGKPIPLPSEYKLGKVPQYILEHAPCQVWLVRQGVPAGS